MKTIKTIEFHKKAQKATDLESLENYKDQIETTNNEIEEHISKTEELEKEQQDLDDKKDKLSEQGDHLLAFNPNLGSTPQVGIAKEK
tara:strand:+ start:399 stop:659 length:261 start_codon:yes stop_codon:yes gene_type:complete